MDFTIRIYKRLLDVLIGAGYTFQSFTEFLEKPADKVILLRHDVDAQKLNSLHFAQIQYSLGIKGTYYFRMVPQSYDEKVILRVAKLGHEIGYHYEDMDFASRWQRAKGKGQIVRSQESRAKSKEYRALDENELLDDALRNFKENLGKLRKLYPVKTICMHGSPRSRFDNKALWKKYNYKDYGIIGEPYFDIDFNNVLYLTDTGRRWDGDKVSVRDKVNGKGQKVEGKELRVQKQESRNENQETRDRRQGSGVKIQKQSFHCTHQIIAAAENDELPDRIMFTFHPQRWTNKPLPWLWELLFQNLKNQLKGYIVKRKSTVTRRKK